MAHHAYLKMYMESTIGKINKKNEGSKIGNNTSFTIFYFKTKLIFFKHW